ncbi:unnamed protein product [Symbiodinium natans]|uniref:Uncharacterized protein n=1 Tax=Symbiodinium natans TaxID=878477 RepID=A0A812P825_9DINO|nr:unnamed protein product [Symbiodinium natans]
MYPPESMRMAEALRSRNSLRALGPCPLHENNAMCSVCSGMCRAAMCGLPATAMCRLPAGAAVSPGSQRPGAFEMPRTSSLAGMPKMHLATTRRNLSQSPDGVGNSGHRPRNCHRRLQGAESTLPLQFCGYTEPLEATHHRGPSGGDVALQSKPASHWSGSASYARCRSRNKAAHLLDQQPLESAF